jgi:hypothetical protein
MEKRTPLIVSCAGFAIGMRLIDREAIFSLLDAVYSDQLRGAQTEAMANVVLRLNDAFGAPA